MAALIQTTEDGLYCEAGGFHIDPWRPVERAVITHAHSDHARAGSARYLCAASGSELLRLRVHAGAAIDALEFGRMLRIGDVGVSLHPAGHVLGSAQVRVEHRGETWVVSGDYKLAPDATCEAFEPVGCSTFISESTFGLPIYRWSDPGTIADQINGWWRERGDGGDLCAIGAYSLGKAQRLLAMLEPSIGPIFVHGALQAMNEAYRKAGVALPATEHARRETVAKARKEGRRPLVLCPPSALDSAWMRGLAGGGGGEVRRAMASGWMQVRGARRRRSLDRGFVLSDHADWSELLRAIGETGAQRVGVTHGCTAPLVRYLREQGREAWEVASHYGGDEGGAEDDGGEGREGSEVQGDGGGGGV